MDQETLQKLTTTAEQLASAAEALDRVLSRLDAQQEALNAKVDRIVAAVEEKVLETGNAGNELEKLQARIAELEKTNADLKAQGQRLARKTLPAAVSALLSKHTSETAEHMDPAALDKALQVLSVEQRIAVKAEMARAGMLD